MSAALYLLWSNEHQMWWRPDARGYTGAIEEAARFTRAAVERQVAVSTCDGQLTVRRTNPVTGEAYEQLSEVMVLAPESIGADRPGAGTVPS
ncbi:hypothetical protein [Actinoplanes sp. N902-109]|uniref:hypothetical protein n=1 Tax=Actinoplanes sp. (strain N902-109) TaxID=649831 RepID=UPI0003294C68|nr:hypothetical protein [Actinoplanes sp. N902-109]AGL19525.1 hypothetical protein L083_6015 [Actinoplanes sp. N902-109]